MVFLDMEDYVQKAENLLQQQDTYRTISVYPTNQQKNKSISLLKRIKVEIHIVDNIY